MVGAERSGMGRERQEGSSWHEVLQAEHTTKYSSGVFILLVIKAIETESGL